MELIKNKCVFKNNNNCLLNKHGNEEAYDFTELYHQFDLLNGELVSNEELALSDNENSENENDSNDINRINIEIKNSSKDRIEEPLCVLNTFGNISLKTNYDFEHFALNRGSTSTTNSKKFDNLFQRHRESRASYLLRSLKLWQEFTNSGNLDNLKILLYDILRKDCIHIGDSSGTATVGRDEIFELQSSFQNLFPDYCVFLNNITRTKKRAITARVNSFGTFSNTTSAQDKLFSSPWNIFENTPIEKLSEHHKIQKQKYDVLKSQKKSFKFETTGMWYLCLTKDCRQVYKIASSKEKVEIFVIS